MAESNRLCVTFRDMKLQQRFDAHFETRNLESNIRHLLDAYDGEQQSVTNYG